MAQGLFGGATSYEEQSLQDILEDVMDWMKYTTDMKTFMSECKENLEENKFWREIPFDYQMTICSSIFYMNTVLHDLDIVKNAIISNCITEKEVNLLRGIGRKSREYNSEYPRTYREESRYWHKYGNKDFLIAEQTYQKGRDYFVTMQDASNAAFRLEDYMQKGQTISNILTINGAVSGSQIQQGNINSTQVMNTENAFEYDKVLDTLEKLKKTAYSSGFNEDFGEDAEKVRIIIEETIKMVNDKEEPSKIKSALKTLKELAVGVTGSIIATGICGVLSQLPIW